MKNKYFLCLLLLIGNTHLSAQYEIVNNVRFVENAIKKSVIDSLMANAIPTDKRYRFQYSQNNDMRLFVANAVKEALDEAGYTTILDDDVDSLENVVEIKILDPNLIFDLRNGLRNISGNFKLLLYSNLKGDIFWGKEMNLSFKENDSVIGSEARLLEQNAPEFLKSKKEVQFTSNKMEKILAGLIAGILTYLLYSVRS